MAIRAWNVGAGSGMIFDGTSIIGGDLQGSLEPIITGQNSFTLRRSYHGATWDEQSYLMSRRIWHQTHPQPVVSGQTMPIGSLARQSGGLLATGAPPLGAHLPSMRPYSVKVSPSGAGSSTTVTVGSTTKSKPAR